MAVPTSTFSNGALGVVLTNLPDGTLEVEMMTTPDGDWQVLTGIDRLQQDTTLFLYKRIGSDSYDPTLGNSLLDYLGNDLDSTDLASNILMGSLTQFQQRQAQQLQAGQLTTDEQAASFEITYISLYAGLLVINLTVTSVAGQTTNVAATIPASS